MCELLGICYAKPIVADFNLRSFAMRDLENADGWGIAWYRGKSLAIAKEPITWRSSKFSNFLQSYPRLRSRIFIAHVRKATVGGEPKRCDTHPFSRELRGREYCFAHNGTVRKAMAHLPVERYVPIGRTDSEHVFCHLLASLAERNCELDDESQWRWLHEYCLAVNKYGKFNCLLSDGVRLFVYHDANGYKGLYRSESYLHKHEHDQLEDALVSVDVQPVAPESNTNVDPGVTVATCPLNNKPSWHKFEPGELVVIEGGRVVYCATDSKAPVAQST